MLRGIAALSLLPLVAAGGCTCGSKTSVVPDAAATAAAASATPVTAPSIAASAGAPPLDASVFSAPIAAARVAHVDVVAGLVAAESVVRVLGMVDGKPAWSADALRGVSWSPDAELHLQPADGGVALMWRGMRDGKAGRTLVVLGPRGEPRSQPADVGSAFCATAEGVAWLDPRTTGPSRVLARRWADADAREVVSVSPERDASLVCGDHSVVVLGDGDDDLTEASFVPGDAAPQPPRVALRDADFGDDEEREHDAFTVGDDLGVVRVASSGAVAVRDVPRGGAPSPWRRLKNALGPDDDVVAVDGDADSTLVLFTREADESCPGVGSTAESVRALRVDRKTGTESVLELAPADCDRSPGPFWIAPSPGAPTIAWVERATKLPPKAAPVVGAAVRTLKTAGVVARRIDLQADALVDGGCDERGCSMAALLRPAGGDGMQPEAIGLLAYP